MICSAQEKAASTKTVPRSCIDVQSAQEAKEKAARLSGLFVCTIRMLLMRKLLLALRYQVGNVSGGEKLIVGRITWALHGSRRSTAEWNNIFELPRRPFEYEFVFTALPVRLNVVNLRDVSHR